MSKQIGINNSEEEVTKPRFKKGHHKRRGPWEVWVIYNRKNKPDFFKSQEFMLRDYATKELAEIAAEKHQRDRYWDTIEIRYNERKE